VFLTSVIVSVGATLLFAWLVFKPITHQRTGESGPRFQLADLFSLIVLWQYGLFLATSIDGNEGDSSGRLVVGGAFILVLTALWLGLCTSLSERNVRSALRRGVVICIGVPLGIVGTIYLLPSVMFSIVRLWNPNAGAEVAWGWVLLACLGAGVVARLSLNWAMRKPVPTSGDERDAAVEVE
jgi:hypothetical protein